MGRIAAHIIQSITGAQGDDEYDPARWWETGNPSWIDQQRARERQRTLQGIIRIVTGMDLAFKPWFPIPGSELGRLKTWRMIWNSESYEPIEMNFLAEDLIAGQNEEAVLGVTFHELFEFLYRHPEASAPEFLNQVGAAVLDNGIGDIWINKIGMNEFMGSRPWLDALYRDKFWARHQGEEGQRQMARQPLYFQFTLGMIYEWAFGQADPSITHPQVLEAMEKLREKTREVHTATTVEDHKRLMMELYETPEFQALVKQSVEDKAQKEALEKDVSFGDGKGGSGERIPWESLTKAQKDKLLKKLQAKWDALSDEEKRELLKKAAQDLSKRDKTVSPSDQPVFLDDKGKPLSPESINRIKKKMADALAKARKEQGEYDENLRQEEEMKLARAQERDRRERDEEGISEKGQGEYNQRYERVRGDIQQMRQVFRIFFQRQNDYWERFRSRGIIDGDALPLILTGEDRVYMQRQVPDKFSVRLSLLIDQSGSMSDGNKISAVADAVLMMLEAIKEDQKNGITLEVVGFHDEFPSEIYFKYGDKLDKAKIVDVIQKVGKTFGGNQDTRAIMMAQRRIPERGNELNLVVHFSDGDPDMQFQRDFFRKIIKSKPHVTVLGLGIGPKAEMILDLYRDGQGLWAQSTRDVPRMLERLLSDYVGRHGRNGPSRTRRLAGEDVGSRQVLQRGASIAPPKGGVVSFLRGSLPLEQYASQAWWRETLHLINIGGLATLLTLAVQGLMGVPLGFDLAILTTSLWGVFFGAHVVDLVLNVGREDSEKTSPWNMYYAGTIVLINGPLAYLLLAPALLIPLLIATAFLSHWAINRWAQREIDSPTSTAGTVLLPPFNPVTPLQEALNPNNYKQNPETPGHGTASSVPGLQGILDRDLETGLSNLLSQVASSREDPLAVNITELFEPQENPVRQNVLVQFLSALNSRAGSDGIRRGTVILLVKNETVAKEVVEKKIRLMFPTLGEEAKLVLASEEKFSSGVFLLDENQKSKISPRGLAARFKLGNPRLAALDVRDFHSDLPGTTVIDLGEVVRVLDRLYQHFLQDRLRTTMA